MHAILSYRGNRPTNTPIHKQTGPITIHSAAASAQCNEVDGEEEEELQEQEEENLFST